MRFRRLPSSGVELRSPSLAALYVRLQTLDRQYSIRLSPMPSTIPTDASVTRSDVPP